MSQIIAIIPARSGSKRIKNKNIIELSGKPLIHWTIEAAIKAGVFAKVLVSTDDEKIAEISRQAHAEVPFLRPHAHDDEAAVSLATLTALKQAESHWQTEYEMVVQLMPNCPLRASHDITDAIAHFKQYQALSLLSCFSFGWMNPWWSFTLEKNGQAQHLFPESLTKRSQDLEELYCVSGSVWITQGKTLKQTQSFYTDDTRYFPIPWKRAIDIDTPEDLDMAKVIKETSGFSERS